MLSRQNGTGVEASVPFSMITLLAESKTMASQQANIAEKDFLDNIPIFEKQADAIMHQLASLTPLEIAANLGISNQLAIKAHNLALEFPHKITGYKSLYAFTGEAFRALDIQSIPEDYLKDIQNKLRFVSSVYGLLRPYDIIKPYRCEFNKKIFSDGKTPIQIYKPKVTVEFVKYIKENKIQDVINLLPGDADKCFDWKIIRAFTRVHKVVFGIIKSDGKIKTPIASRLKELRGLMSRAIIEQKIESFEQLKTIKSDQFIFSPEDSKPLLPLFLSSE